MLDQTLATGHGVGAGGEQGAGQTRDAGVELIRGHDFMHQADAQRLVRAKALCRQEPAVRCARAHGANDVGADRCGNHPQARLAQTKLHAAGRNRHVAGRHQACAARIHIALHARDGRLGAFVKGAQHAGQCASVGQVFFMRVVGHAPHPVQIGPGAEGRAGGRQYDAAHIDARTQFQKSLRQFGDHLLVEGVAHLGAVQSDRADGAAATQHQMFERGHALHQRFGGIGRRSGVRRAAASIALGDFFQHNFGGAAADGQDAGVAP